MNQYETIADYRNKTRLPVSNLGEIDKCRQFVSLVIDKFPNVFNESKKHTDYDHRAALVWLLRRLRGLANSEITRIDNRITKDISIWDIKKVDSLLSIKEKRVANTINDLIPLYEHFFGKTMPQTNADRNYSSLQTNILTRACLHTHVEIRNFMRSEANKDLPEQLVTSFLDISEIAGQGINPIGLLVGTEAATANLLISIVEDLYLQSGASDKKANEKGFILSRNRFDEISIIRTAICHTLRTRLYMTLSAIGRLMNRDHSTINHLCSLAEDRIYMKDMFFIHLAEFVDTVLQRVAQSLLFGDELSLSDMPKFPTPEFQRYKVVFDRLFSACKLETTNDDGLGEASLTNAIYYVLWNKLNLKSLDIYRLRGNTTNKCHGFGIVKNVQNQLSDMREKTIKLVKLVNSHLKNAVMGTTFEGRI